MKADIFGNNKNLVLNDLIKYLIFKIPTIKFNLKILLNNKNIYLLNIYLNKFIIAILLFFKICININNF